MVPQVRVRSVDANLGLHYFERKRICRPVYDNHGGVKALPEIGIVEIESSGTKHKETAIRRLWRSRSHRFLDDSCGGSMSVASPRKLVEDGDG
jgi:hypothetical protein